MVSHCGWTMLVCQIFSLCIIWQSMQPTNDNCRVNTQVQKLKISLTGQTVLEQLDFQKLKECKRDKISIEAHISL